MIDYLEGVQLRRIEERDLETLRGWRNDERVRKWCRQNDLISETEQSQWFRGLAGDKSRSMYVIEAEAPVGVCGLTSIDHVNGRAEFSLYIAPDRHKKGYGRKALRTLFTHGFRGLGLNLIWGETFEGNPAAKLFQAIGMTNEGTRRAFYWRSGKYISADLYSITAEEWR